MYIILWKTRGWPVSFTRKTVNRRRPPVVQGARRLKFGSDGGESRRETLLYIVKTYLIMCTHLHSTAGSFLLQEISFSHAVLQNTLPINAAETQALSSPKCTTGADARQTRVALLLTITRHTHLWSFYPRYVDYKQATPGGPPTRKVKSTIFSNS